MRKPQVHRLPRAGESTSGPVAAGVTAYVVDAPEILAGDHPLLNAIAELGVTANQFAADAQVLVVVRKATNAGGFDQ